MYRNILLIFLFVFILAKSFGQNPVELQKGSPQQYKFNHYTSKDGLPQNSVLSIHQDRWGFLWMGTDDGLARFDGYKFMVYRHDAESLTSITNNVVRAIVSDIHDFIWVGTEGGGINVLNPKTGQFHALQITTVDGQETTVLKTSSLIKDRRGNIWAGTNGNGVYLIEGFGNIEPKDGLPQLDQKLTATPFNNKNSVLKDNKIWNIYEDQNGVVWIGTLEGGAYTFNPQDSKMVQFPLVENGKIIESVKNFYEDSNGNFWIGTERSGIFIKWNGSDEFVHLSLPQNRRLFQQIELNITSFKEDSQGNIWIGTLGRGAYVFDSETNFISHFEDDPTDPYSISGNSIFTISEDNTGNIWLGMYSGEGLNQTNPLQQQFEHIRYDPTLQRGLSGKMVKSILEDNNGDLWFGLFNGGLNLLQKNSSQFQYFTANENGGLSHNHIQVLYQASDENVWIGTDGGGINIYNPKSDTFKHLQHNPTDPNSLSKDEVWAIVEDFQGNFWIGTANGGGLNKFDPESNSFSRYLHQAENEQSPLLNDIRALMTDSKNNLWIGTYGGGLSRLNLENMVFDHFKVSNSEKTGLSHGMVTSILEDQAGFVWVGTFGGGLNRINPIDGNIVVFREKDGLPSDVIKAILEDNSGQLWISTVNGLSSFDVKEMTFKNYSEEDGLQSDEFNLGSAFKNNEGKLFFGGTNGLNAFFPERITLNPTPNTPIITQLKILNQTVLPGEKVLDKILLDENISFVEKLRLNHSHNSFEFEFSALEFQSQEKIQFSYILAGYDKSWITTDSKRRFANYANLPPGKYQFKIRAFFENDSTYSPEKILYLTVLPPWYKTYWAYLIYALLFIAIGYGAKSLIAWRSNSKMI